MLDALSRKGQFEPIHAAHAIDQVVFNLLFDKPLDDTGFSEVREVAKQFMSELPGRIETRGLTVMIDFQVGTPQVSEGGFGLRKVRPDGVVENELLIDRTSITFRTTLYSRWDAVWSQASKYFKVFISIYAAQARISALTLHYVDKFKWVGTLSECRPAYLLRAESMYLCPHVYEAKDLWHSHTGAFIQVGSDTKRLLNVNVDYLDENLFGDKSRVVVIATVLTDQLNLPGYEACPAKADEIIVLVDTHMQELHLFGKKVFGYIVNDEMCRRIALIG